MRYSVGVSSISCSPILTRCCAYSIERSPIVVVVCMACACSLAVKCARLSAVRTRVESAYFVLVLAASRHNDDGDGRELTHALAHRETVHPGHHHIEQHQVGCMLLDLLQRLLAIACHQDLVVFQLEIACDQPQ